jgi:hypothetical protein
LSIPLDDAPEFIPSIKLREVGDQVVGHIIDYTRRPEKDFKTGKPKLNAKGDQRTELVITVMVASASPKVVLGSKDNQSTPSEGDEARIYLQGRACGFWIDAQKAHRANGGLAVGDRFLWEYRSNQPNEYDPEKPLANRFFTFRKPNEAEKEAVLVCEQRHRELRQDAGPQENSEADPPLSDEITF